MAAHPLRAGSGVPWRVAGPPQHRGKRSQLRYCLADSGAGWLLTMLAAAGLLGGCSGESSPLSSRHMEFDVGEVYLEPATPQNWNAVAEFVFTNASSDQQARLEVRNKSCGCSVVEIERPRLAPGAKSRIRVGFSAPYARQERAESVRIATGLADYPDFVVTVKASLCPRLLLEVEGPPQVLVPWEGEARVRATTIAYQPARELQREFRLTVSDPEIAARSLGQPTSVLYGQMRKEWQE